MSIRKRKLELPQHLGRDLLAGRVVDGRDLDRGAHLPNVAGDLPDELRALVDREDGPALGLALLLGLGLPLALLARRKYRRYKCLDYLADRGCSASRCVWRV